LVGDALFRGAMHIPQGWHRLGAAGVALATIVLGTAFSGVVQLSALLATLVVMLVIDTRRMIAR
jgi:hypothetical protein